MLSEEAGMMPSLAPKWVGLSFMLQGPLLEEDLKEVW